MKFYFGLGKNYREAKKRGVDFQKTEHFAHSPLASRTHTRLGLPTRSHRAGRKGGERGGVTHTGTSMYGIDFHISNRMSRTRGTTKQRRLDTR